MSSRVAALGLVACLGFAWPAEVARAQLLGNVENGQSGLLAGTQNPVGLNFNPGFCLFHTSSYRGVDGTLHHTAVSENMANAPSISVAWIGPRKILGANYGVWISIWGASGRIDMTFDDSKQVVYGFGDTWIKPLELGWSFPHIDVLAGVAGYIPTGVYQPGGSYNTGYGMWGVEPSVGFTLWPDRGHHWNFATLIYYDIYSPRRGTIGPNGAHLRVGDILSVQGALGYQFGDGTWIVGVPYYLQWKTTPDTIPNLGLLLPGVTAAKSFYGGLGLEVDWNPTDLDSFSVRWVQEIRGINAFMGPNVFLSYNRVFQIGRARPAAASGTASGARPVNGPFAFW